MGVTDGCGKGVALGGTVVAAGVGGGSVEGPAQPEIQSAKIKSHEPAAAVQWGRRRLGIAISI
jgi:hypothetical protein